MQSHYSNTRKIQRTLTKYLKSLGLTVTNNSAKQVLGWQSKVANVVVSKTVKSVCKSLTGDNVLVLTK